MNGRHRRVVAALVALAAAGALAVVALGAPPEPQQPTEVLKWNQIAVSTLLVAPIGTMPGPAGGAPPAAQIHLGMTQGAVYDAVNATEPKHYRPYLLKRPFSARASKNAAVATAAYEVLSSIVRGVPQSIAFPNRQALLDSLTSAYNDSLDDIDDSPFEAGDRRRPRRGRGDDRRPAGRRSLRPVSVARSSEWRSQPDSGGALEPATSQRDDRTRSDRVGRRRKAVLIESSSQFRSAGPLALGSSAYATEFNEVKERGGDGVITSTFRTPAQTSVALFWTGAGGPFWSVTARDLIEDQGVDLADSARLLAMMNLAGADAAINCWNDKYHFDFWRPWNAIARAGEDGNPATAAQAGWTPLRSAPYPDHPSGHMCLDGAHIGALQSFFGTDEMEFDVASFVVPGGSHFARFWEPLAEIEDARVWSGLHYRTADEQGRQLGENVADYMTHHYFQTVGQP